MFRSVGTSLPQFAVLALAILVAQLTMLPAAFADASAGPGQTVAVPVKQGGYTILTIENPSKETVEVVIEGGAFKQTITLAPGEIFKQTTIFDVKQVMITNKSKTATLKIRSKWL